MGVDRRHSRFRGHITFDEEGEPLGILLSCQRSGVRCASQTPGQRHQTAYREWRQNALAWWHHFHTSDDFEAISAGEYQKVARLTISWRLKETFQ